MNWTQRWHQISGQQEAVGASDEVLTARFKFLRPSLSPEGSQLLVPSATNMQTQGVPRFNDSLSWMGSKHIKTACWRPLRVEDPWGRGVSINFGDESRWHTVSFRNHQPAIQKCFWGLLLRDSNSLSGFDLCASGWPGAQFLALGESTWGESRVEMLSNYLMTMTCTLH